MNVSVKEESCRSTENDSLCSGHGVCITSIHQVHNRNSKVQIRIVCASKIAFISLPINLNICFVCSKEPPHRDGSFEYPEHMIWLRNKNFFQFAFLSGGLTEYSHFNKWALLWLLTYVPFKGH